MKINVLEGEDIYLMGACIDLALITWKKWVDELYLPPDWDLKSSLEMVEKISSLQTKWNTFFSKEDKDDLRDIDDILVEEEGPPPDNVLHFPTVEA
mgnify:CR=1 FL=1